METIEWKTEKRKITELKNWEDNPRTITEEDYKKLEESVKKLGNFQPLVANIDGTVLSGNQRLRLAVANGDTDIEVSIPNRKLSAKEASEVGIVANTHSGQWDMDKLANNFEDIVKGLGLDDLLPEVVIETKEDDYEEPEQLPSKVQLGEVWQLGKHRLMCGDSTKIEDVEKLMDGNKADMVFTDPPYGVDFQSNMRTKTKKFDILKNDDVMLTEWVAPATSLSTGWILFCTTWKVLAEWLEIGKQIGKLSNMVIWDKGGGGIGDLEHSLLTDYEVILAYGRGNKIHGKRLGSVWSIGKDGSMEYEHPTQKPIKLAGQAIETFSSGSVLDLFGGSGSTLIACEQLDRICYMMELDTHYCDVIIDRWEKLTGQTATNITP